MRGPTSQSLRIIPWPWPLIEVHPLVPNHLIVFAGSRLMTTLVPIEGRGSRGRHRPAPRQKLPLVSYVVSDPTHVLPPVRSHGALVHRWFDHGRALRPCCQRPAGAAARGPAARLPMSLVAVGASDAQRSSRRRCRPPAPGPFHSSPRDPCPISWRRVQRAPAACGAPGGDCRERPSPDQMGWH